MARTPTNLGGDFLYENGSHISSGGGHVGTATLDFGVFPGKSHATVVITGQTGIDVSNVPMVLMKPVATADHTADEHMLETISLFATDIIAGTGFTIQGINNSQLGDTLIYGQWTVGWSWS